MNFEAVKTHLESRGFQVSALATGAEAAAYLNARIDGTTVGFGGSATLKELGLYESLSAHNEVHWHWVNGPAERDAAMDTAVYLCSANALAETGEIINIDGNGNRIASTLYGHKKVYFVIGRNKLAPTFDEALWRARNVAAPKRAQQLNRKTPCAVKADRCYDCKSPDRVCRGLAVLWAPIAAFDTEVLLVDEDLGL